MKKYKIWLVFVAVLLVGTIWATIENIIIRPFPFIDVSYISSIEEFNAPPIRLDIDINLPLSIETIKKAVSYTERYNYESNNNLFGDIQKATAATTSAQPADHRAPRCAHVIRPQLRPDARCRPR